MNDFILKKSIEEVGYNSVIVLDETGSTNDDAKELIISNPEQFSVIIAKKQLLGRGRFGKSFYSPNGGIYLSVIIRKTELPLTILSAIAISKTLDEYNITNKIKWVNDIYVNDKKVAGILCESLGDYSIIGIGVNVCEPKGGFPKDIENIAGSLKNGVNTAELTKDLLKNLRIEIDRADISGALLMYKERDYLLNKNVIIHYQQEDIQAICKGITDDFKLIVDDGEIKEISSGVVSIEVKKEN